MSKRLVREAAASMYKDAGNGFVNVLDSVRRAVVEEGWFGKGHLPTLAGGIHGQATPHETTITRESHVANRLDPLVRTPEAEPTRDWSQVPAAERAGMAALYGHYQELGGDKLLEFENSMDTAYHGWFQGAEAGEKASVVEVCGDGDMDFAAPSLSDMEDAAELQ